MISPGKLFITVAFLMVAGCGKKSNPAMSAMPTVPTSVSNIEAHGVVWEEVGVGAGAQLKVQRMILNNEFSSATLWDVTLQVGELEMKVERADYHEGILRGARFKLGKSSFWIGGHQFELDLQTNDFHARSVRAVWDGGDISRPGR